jgi:8-oxo-dGTP pyrophosphatase MutT (NUDIX family)
MTIPDLESIDNVRKRGFRPVAVGCLLFEKTALFVYKEAYDLWGLPQGGVDNGETIELALKREMAEELGTACAATMEDGVELVLEDEVEFPPATRGTREMKTDEGEKIFMRGKRYYFIATPVSAPTINVEESEFDSAKWVTYEQGIEMAAEMKQRGKKRVTERVLKALKKKGLM